MKNICVLFAGVTLSHGAAAAVYSIHADFFGDLRGSAAGSGELVNMAESSFLYDSETNILTMHWFEHWLAATVGVPVANSIIHFSGYIDLNEQVAYKSVVGCEDYTLSNGQEGIGCEALATDWPTQGEGYAVFSESNAGPDSPISILDRYGVDFETVGFSGYMFSMQGLSLNTYNQAQGTLRTELWTFTVAEVPVPAALWLFGSALIGVVGFKRK